MEHLSHISAFLIVILACCAIGNCAETKSLFKSTENNQYFVQPAYKYTWHEAFEECNKMGMDMLTIRTAEKAKEIESLLFSLFTSKRIPRFHISANDLDEFRKFSWITSEGRKEFTFTNWEKTEPNNYKKLNERCVHIGFHATLEWNDINCSRKYGFICQERLNFKELVNQVPMA